MPDDAVVDILRDIGLVAHDEAAVAKTNVLHERRIVYRGTLRPSSSSGNVRLRRTVRDLYGPDSLVIRSTGPRAESCRIAAEL